MHRPALNNQTGFTLTELLISTALIGILTVFLASIYIGTTSLFSQQSLEIQVVQAATRLTDVLLENIRTAEFVVDTLTVSPDTFTTGTDTLILAIPSIDASQDPIVGTYDYYIFYQDQINTTDFRWKLVPNVASSRTSFDKLAAEEITNLSITYNTTIPADASKITVDFTLQKANSTDIIDITRAVSANLRNK